MTVTADYQIMLEKSREKHVTLLCAVDRHTYACYMLYVTQSNTRLKECVHNDKFLISII